MTPQNQQQQSPIQPVGGGSEVRDQDKIMLILAYLGLLAIIPLVTVKDSEYVKWHAKQGLVLFGAAIVLSFLNVIPVVGQIVFCLGSLGVFVLSIMGIVKALAGQRWRMPLLADLADKINM